MLGHRTAPHPPPARAVQQTRLLAWSTLALLCRPHLADRVGPRSFARRFTFSTNNAEGKVWPPLRQIEWRYAHPVISLNVTTPPNTRATLVTCRDTVIVCNVLLCGGGEGGFLVHMSCVWAFWFPCLSFCAHVRVRVREGVFCAPAYHNHGFKTTPMTSYSALTHTPHHPLKGDF